MHLRDSLRATVEHTVQPAKLSVILDCSILYYRVLVIQHYAILYYSMLQYDILHTIILYYIILHCIILYDIAGPLASLSAGSATPRTLVYYMLYITLHHVV